jgi:putative drug exporter of the RND superfamily
VSTVRRAVARALISLRLIVIVAWIGAAVAVGLTLDPIGQRGGGTLGALVPKDAPALMAEKLSATLFEFPLVSQSVVVVRNPHGLALTRQAELVRLATSLSLGHVREFRSVAAAIPIVNTLGPAPFAREHGTTVLLNLYFRRSVSTIRRSQLAHRLVARFLGQQAGEFVGVTGPVPARAVRGNLINDNLGWVEIATIVLVALAIAVHFRAVGAPLLTLLTIGVSYVLADRLVEQFGRLIGVSVPAEVQPVLVVLVFGVVTDYCVFFLSAFRSALARGEAATDAAEGVLRRTAPIVFVAGITVATGTAALVVARLDFLKAFGPGLAVAVIIAMAVSVTLVPALLALSGEKLFWPSRAAQRAAAPREQPPTDRHKRRDQLVRFVVGRPAVATAGACVLIAGASSGLAFMALGNELILGLPTGAGPHKAYAEATAGFTPGALAPAVVLVTGTDTASHRSELAALQRKIARQPGVAVVLGPAQQPLRRSFGVTVAKGGNAARYAVFLDSDPLSARAIADVRALNHQLSKLMRGSGLAGYHTLIGGDTALSADSVDETLADLGRVTPTLLIAIFIVIAIFLRALVAPAFLVLTSGLAVLASLGLTVYVLQMIAGYDQITYYSVFVVAVLLVSLGSDYNVFVVGRIWQAGRRRPFREAVKSAAADASRPVTTAGLVLAMSFALLAIVPVRAFREIAFAMGVGLMIDTFIVRTILAPALLALVGPLSSWPGRTLFAATRRRARGALQSSPGSDG